MSCRGTTCTIVFELKAVTVRYLRCHGAAVPACIITANSHVFTAAQQVRQAGEHIPGVRQPVRDIDDLTL